MAHELSIRASGFVEFAHVGEKGWHKLGNQLPHGASLQEWRAAAGMDWQLMRAPSLFMVNGELKAFHGQTVLYRSDTGAPIGMVSPDYEIVQPVEVLEFMHSLASDYGMQLETAGVLFDGKRFFALAKMGEQTVMGGDKVSGYLLISTSADGTAATEIRQTTVRVVCMNTLRLALSETGQALPVIKVSHRSAFESKKVRDQLNLSRDNFDRGMDIARALAQVKVTDAGAADYVRALLRPTEHAAKQAAAQVAAQAEPGADFAAMLARPVQLADTEEKKARAPRGEAQILELFGSSAIGGNLTGADGTAWGLLNAVTEYVDHHSTAKTADHRASNAWFGTGDEMKNSALELARERFL